MSTQRAALLVLLSTWNGAQYVREQLQSILDQQVDADIRILVRDDGSTDDTLAQIAAIGSDRIEAVRGRNIGAKASYFDLLARARSRPSALYVAFADQDDVWKPGKLAAALARLQLSSRPTLYCSAVTLVNERLNPIREYRHDQRIDLRTLLLSNCAVGCTVVMNRALVEAIEPPLPCDDAWMHDWWCVLVAAVVGEVAYDSTSRVLYRQHPGNHVGLPTGAMSRLRRFWIDSTHAPRATPVTQAQALQRAYGTKMSPEQLRIVQRLASTRAKPSMRIGFALWDWPLRADPLHAILQRLLFVRRG